MHELQVEREKTIIEKGEHFRLGGGGNIKSCNVHVCTAIEQLSEENAQLMHKIEKLELQLKNMDEVDTLLLKCTVYNNGIFEWYRQLLHSVFLLVNLKHPV